MYFGCSSKQNLAIQIMRMRCPTSRYAPISLLLVSSCLVNSIQHQNAQKRMQQQQAGIPMPLGNQPPQPSNSQTQPQAPIRGMPNGMTLQRQPSAYHTNGAMPNGINPAMGGQPAQPGQISQQLHGQPGVLNFGGQPNGITAAQQGGSQQPGTQTMSFNSMMSGAATQRPMNGQPQQLGQQQPRGSFTSPPMTHSPQGGAGGQPGPPAPMAQLGPSPQMMPMSRSMLPPNAASMSGPTGPMNIPIPQHGAPPNGAFNPGQGSQGPHGQGPNPRPPSRSRPTPSPSMSSRQPPGAGPQQQGGMMMVPGMGGMNLGGMAGNVGDHEIQMIPPSILSGLKHELGFGDKDLNMSDKVGF